jgi:hypothetical protein
MFMTQRSKNSSPAPNVCLAAMSGLTAGKGSVWAYLLVRHEPLIVSAIRSRIPHSPLEVGQVEQIAIGDGIYRGCAVITEGRLAIDS